MIRAAALGAALAAVWGSLLWGAPGRAQQEMSADDSPISADEVYQCVQASSPQNCIGMIAWTCEAQGNGQGPCLGMENRFWLDQIALLSDQLAGVDLRIRDVGSRRASPASLTDLATINAAHSALLEQRCAYEATAWAGMHSGPIEFECRIRENARHALWLWGMLVNG